MSASVGTGCLSLFAFEAGRDLGRDIAPPSLLNCTFVFNGCGPTGALGLLIPNCPFDLICFNDFCDGHDLCYATCGSSKTACDEQFYANMRFLCEVAFEEDDPDREQCDGAAYIYWQIVARFGGSFFLETQAAACRCAEREGVDIGDANARLLDDAFGPAIDGVAPFDDADDDLMPDAWEIEFGCDPSDASDALADHDLDGRVNLQEFLLGTDPLVPDTFADNRIEAPQSRP